MFSHVMVGSNDTARSKEFYDALFAAMGGGPGIVDAEKDRLYYRHNGAALLVGRPLDGHSATFANGGTVGFTMDDPAQADAWHAAGVAAGGKAIEDPPGWRERPGYRLYLAYLRDPDGNKLCAFNREEL